MHLIQMQGLVSERNMKNKKHPGYPMRSQRMQQNGKKDSGILGKEQYWRIKKNPEY